MLKLRSSEKDFCLRCMPIAHQYVEFLSSSLNMLTSAMTRISKSSHFGYIQFLLISYLIPTLHVSTSYILINFHLPSISSGFLVTSYLKSHPSLLTICFLWHPDLSSVKEFQNNFAMPSYCQEAHFLVLQNP